MKVYVVTSGQYSDYGIEAMFSTPEKAQAFIAKQDFNEDRGREEWELDEWEHALKTECWETVIKLETGETRNRDTERIGTWTRFVPNPRWTETENTWWNIPRYDQPCDAIRALSVVSQEHATKIAVEARQKWLRDKAANPS